MQTTLLTICKPECRLKSGIAKTRHAGTNHLKSNYHSVVVDSRDDRTIANLRTILPKQSDGTNDGALGSPTRQSAASYDGSYGPAR